MKNSMKDQLNTALQEMDWHGEAAVLHRIRQARMRRCPCPSRALVFAAVLLLSLIATALALTFHFSADYRFVRQARQVLSAQYGLSNEMLDLFTCTVTEDEVTWISQQHSLHLGEYTVRREADGELSAAWSHDGADEALLASGDLSSPAWGAKQLERILTAYQAKAVNWSLLTDLSALTLEEAAALDAPMLDVQQVGLLIHIVPDEDDLSAEEAEAIARLAIAEKYGVAADALSDMAYVSFFLYGGTQRREYRFDLDGYVVYVASPAGDVTYCRWNIPAENRTLPEGSLSQYPQAAAEYISSGAFALLSASDKADVSARYQAAGLGSLLPREDFTTPLPTEMTEVEAIRLAESTLEAAYALPSGWQTLFTVRTAMVQADSRVWVVEFLPHELENWRWRDYEKLGAYTVTIDSASASALSHAWSLDGAALEGYTESTFAQAPAYSAAMLPWVQALLNDLQAIVDKYPAYANLDEMSLTDRGAYAARMRAAGYSAAQYSDLIPQDSDIPQEEAAALAWDALCALYGDMCAALTRGEPEQEGLTMVESADGILRVWRIVYTDNLDIFTIQVNAQTGEIMNIWHDSPAFGNG